MNYKISDNSYCINIETGEPAWLVQQHYGYYSPDKNEDGAIFEIVSEPYVEHVKILSEYIDRTFINVKSSLTGNIYRVLYCEDHIYHNPNRPKMVNLEKIIEYLTPRLEADLGYYTAGDFINNLRKEFEYGKEI